MLHKISETFILEFFELSRILDDATLHDVTLVLHYFYDATSMMQYF